MSDISQSVRVAVYDQLAESGRPPTLDELVEALDASEAAVTDALAANAERRFLVLTPDGRSIRMASPFSGVATQHVVESRGVRYFANCGWDALGIVAALRRDGIVHSRCEHTKTPLQLPVGEDGPPASDWLFHSELPAALWWRDIVYT